jgi:two-component system, NtrC family, response regulator AtoC
MSHTPPLVLVIDDDAAARGGVEEMLRRRGYRTRGAGRADDAVGCVESERPSAVVLDVVVPGVDGLSTLASIKRADPQLPVILVSSQAQTSTVVQAMRLGAADFLCRPFDDDALLSPLEHALHQQQLAAELAPLRRQVAAEPRYRLMIGSSAKMADVQGLIERVADTDATVLVRGESGTGKELVARAIHAGSSRVDRPFVKVNCAALPSELLESELFGYERGAFTGAVQQKPGRFEFANQGTMFLDEIGDMGLPLQAKLLQVLQDGEFSRLGGKSDVRVDVRIVAATNRDLEHAVAEGLFREDLFFRLNVVSIVLPPLRERREDVAMFVEHFLRRFSVHYNKPSPPLQPSTMRLLAEYDWPGNVRELENAVRRMVILGTDSPVVRDIQRALAARPPAPRAAGVAAAAVAPVAVVAASPDNGADGRIPPAQEADEGASAATGSLKDIARAAARAAECVAIARMLQRTRWNRKAAAEILGISYKALLYKIKENGLDKLPSTS